MNHASRIEKLQSKLGELDALLVTDLQNVRYLSGFTGSSATMVVARDGAWFFTDGRYRTQSKEQVTDAEARIYGTMAEFAEALQESVKVLGVSRLGFESADMRVASFEKTKERFEGVELVSTESLVEDLRKVKDAEELALIRTAAEMADAGLGYVLERVEVGKTERELALDLEFFMRREGADDVSFDPIVAAAERSALPHAHPSERQVEKGAYLLFDLGCIYKGYCSDLTRTFVVGSPEDRHRDVYEVVLASQQASLDAIKPGVECRAIDKAARDVIAAAGYPEAFSHGLGHGVGIEIHEAPTLGRESTDILTAGQVVTVEPGAYFEGWGGVRIEDLVFVTEDGIEIVSKFPKELRTL